MGIPFDAMCKDIHFLSYRKETLHTRLLSACYNAWQFDYTERYHYLELQCRLVLSFDSGNIQPSNNNSRNLVIFNFVIKNNNWALPKSFSVYVIIMYMYFEGAE